jgi:type I phosphodiesterase/nucleotide pyrophosphatase
MMVDQMTWDYLYRYQARFVDGGFKRLLTEGFNCENTRINYIPAYTAIGHSSVHTGSVPSIHGIAGNDFYKDGKPIYCTQDTLVASVGVPNGKSGQMSPRNLLTTTIADELRIATNFRSKTIGIAIKDRASILPAGHTANGAYWLDDASGNFITSTYYRTELPDWVKKFNARGRVKELLSQGWKPLYDLKTYRESTADKTDYEQPWGKKGEVPATLPLDTKALMKTNGLGVIRTTPFGNTLTFEMAKAAIEGEHLGEGKETDFLAMSLSATDYIGHRYGTFSVETEDTYLRLDRELAFFLNYLGRKVGEDGYLFILTADHAAAHNLTFNRDHKIPGEALRSDIARSIIDSAARAFIGSEAKVVQAYFNYQVFFDDARLDALNIDRLALQRAISKALKDKLPGVAYAIPAADVVNAPIPEAIKTRIINGYRKGRSGDIFVVPDPGWYSKGSAETPRGTTHGVWSPYDTHIPLIFMGKSICSGHLYRETYITDIAATLAALLKTQYPSGCIGHPITEAFDED